MFIIHYRDECAFESKLIPHDGWFIYETVLASMIAFLGSYVNGVEGFEEPTKAVLRCRMLCKCSHDPFHVILYNNPWPRKTWCQRKIKKKVRFSYLSDLDHRSCSLSLDVPQLPVNDFLCLLSCFLVVYYCFLAFSSSQRHNVRIGFISTSTNYHLTPTTARIFTPLDIRRSINTFNTFNVSNSPIQIVSSCW